MRIELSLAELPGHRGDAFALVAHGFSLKSEAPSPKSKVVYGAKILNQLALLLRLASTRNKIKLGNVR
jgi:hypothetical protein